MQFRKQGFVLGAILMCASISTPAYNESGHYFTTNLVTHEVTPALNPDDARLIAFCAQLPDMSADLDATVMFESFMDSLSPSIAWDRLHWIFTDVSVPPNSLEGRQMATIQQLVHALTGGDAQTVQRVAGQTLTQLRAQVPTAAADPASQSARSAALCALGFGYHLYGDSFAHHMLDDHRGNHFSTMYATGFGHFTDLHYPDYPLCDQFAPGEHVSQHCTSVGNDRTAAWRTYLGLAAGYLVTTPQGVTITPAIAASIDRTAKALQSTANDGNDWGDDALAAALMQKVWDDFPSVSNFESMMPGFITQHHSQMPCEDVLKDAFAAGGPLQGIPHFACWQVWKQYYPVVSGTFESDENVAARASKHGYDKAYCEPFVKDDDYCGNSDFNGENRDQLTDPPASEPNTP